jgi:alpha-glucoside transport system permease protein
VSRRRLQGRASPVARLAVVALCVLWLVPAIGILLTSVRTPDAVNSSGWWTMFRLPFDPSQLTFASYRQAWYMGLQFSFINSLAVTLPAVIIPVVIAGTASYAFALMRFPGRDLLFVVIVGLLVVPNQVALAPLLAFYGRVHMTGTYAAVYLTHIGFGLPLAIFILRTYMKTLPLSVIESAKVDGASHFQIFWRLVIPLSVPGLAAFAIFQYLVVWNDLLIALLYLGEGDRQVLTVTLGGLIGGNQLLGWQLVTGAAVITMAVPVVVFLTLQRYFVQGLAAGSVGG